MTLAAGIDFGRHGDRTVSTVVDDSAEPWRLVRYFIAFGHRYEVYLCPIRELLVGVLPILSDATGVGDALYHRIPAVGVVMTGNRHMTDKPFHRLPDRRIIVSTHALFAPLAARVNQHGLIVDCEAPALKTELINFVATYTRRGTMRLAARRGHDDAVFALALAVFGATYREELCQLN